MRSSTSFDLVNLVTMSVYIFEKSLLDRLDESANVLKCKETNVPAGQVHSEWAYHVELQLEPAGEFHFVKHTNTKSIYAVDF